MPYDKADEWFASLTAVSAVVLGFFCFLATWSVALAIWKAGFTMVVALGVGFVGLFYASRFLYRAIVKNEWI